MYACLNVYAHNSLALCYHMLKSDPRSAHANFGDVYPGGRGGTSKEDISILKYKKNCNWYGQKRKYCVHA